MNTPYVEKVKRSQWQMRESERRQQQFNISSEDFPALTRSPVNPSNRKTKKQDAGRSPFVPRRNTKTKDDLPKKTKKKLELLPNGTVTNLPTNMLRDQYGIAGLFVGLNVNDPDPEGLTFLSGGVELSHLGLDLNAGQTLHENFGGPWTRYSARPQDVDVHVPPEYYIHSQIKNRLPPIKLIRCTEEVLFYLFYTQVGDGLQILTAEELYNRRWRYHIDFKVWLTQAPGLPPFEKTLTYERGTYIYFDPYNWRKIGKEFILEFSKIEPKPTTRHVPNLLNY